MRNNVKTSYAALALLASGSTPWACESRGSVDDQPSGMARQVPQPLTSSRNDNSILFEPWYEACGEAGPQPKSVAPEYDSKSADAIGTFTIPATAAYGWLAVRYTRGKDCGSAKVYFDGRFVEPLQLHAAEASEWCERVYYLEDHSAKEHRFEVLVEPRAGNGNHGYACLDAVVAGW